jgi:hypothetical protein
MQDVIIEQNLSHFNSPHSFMQIKEYNILTQESESNLNTVFVTKNKKSRTYVNKYISTQFNVNKQVMVRRKTPINYGVYGTYIKGINKNTRIFLEDQIKGNKNDKINKTRNRDISHGMLRQLKKRVNKVKKNILLNILRNKSINLLFYSIQNYFYTKNSLLTLIKFEQHTSKLFLNLRSLIFYISNLYKGLIFFKFTPTMIFST